MNKNYTKRREGDTLYIDITPPPALFKYQSINDYSVQAILDGKIFGTTPSTFNDNYDTMFCYRKPFLIKRIMEYLSEERKQSYMAFFEVPTPQDAVEYIVDEIVNALYKELRNNYVVSCFSEDLFNDVMWGQYANKSSGFVTEYDGKELLKASRTTNEIYYMLRENSGKKIAAKKNTTILPIIYNNQKANSEEFIFNSLEAVLKFYDNAYAHPTNYLLKNTKKRLPISIFEPYKEGLDNLFYNSICQKKKSWSYEKEWRIWAHNISSLSSPTPHAYCEVCVDVKPKAIYLGEKINQYHTIALCAIAKKMQIPVYKMKTVMTKTNCKLKKMLIQSI